MRPQHVEQVQRRRVWKEDDPVLLHHVAQGDDMPRFGEDRWNLSWLSRPRKQGPTTLDFTRIPQAHRLLAKELIAHRLNFITYSTRLNKFNEPFDPQTCNNMLRSFRSLCLFMDRNGVGAVHLLQPEHVRNFTASVLLNDRSPIFNAAQIRILVWLWESREAVTPRGLGFDPWQGQATARVAGHEASEETTTPRVPEPVMSALLRWALAYVEHFSRDIMAARDRYAFEPQPWHADDGLMGDRFDTYVLHLKATRSKLPGAVCMEGKRISKRLIRADTGIPETWFSSKAGIAALKEAIKQVGIDGRPMSITELGTETDSVAWRSAMSVSDLHVESQHLVSACYIVCAYLSGMRDSEVQDLRSGCLEEDLDERGVVERYRLRGRTYKGRKRPLERTWVVIEPVAKAIRVVERLREQHRRTREDDHLFVRLWRHGRAGSFIAKGINDHLNDFASHCSDHIAPRLAASDRADPGGRNWSHVTPIPDGPMGRWRFTTRQFRKTLAWHIANVPFGIIAGMIQYGHSCIMMFEGYAGTSESGFRDEVEREDALARLDSVVDMFKDSRVGIRPSGPKAEELLAEFEDIVASIGELPGEVVDETRLRQLLKHRSTQMRFGVLSHCFFEPSQAKCLAHLPVESRYEPVIGVCDPGCLNACWTHLHVSAWERLQQEAADYAKINRISQLQRDHAKRTIAGCSKVIQAIREAASGQAIQ